MTTLTRVEAEAHPVTITSLPFRKDVEGLRAVAVSLVVLFHAGVAELAGGYVGVDVFFVISGFLITTLLILERRRHGAISLRAFYTRRARRILPAACLVIVATGIATLYLRPALATFRGASDLLSAGFYYANWHFISAENDYLAADAAHSPVLHYWSLAIEEQFYIVWPALVVLCFALIAKVRLQVNVILAVMTGIVVTVSFAYGVWLTVADPTAAYMSTFTRAWQFAAGALVALAGLRAGSRAGQGPWRVQLGWLGLSAIVLSAFLYDRGTAYPGAAALLPTIGTMLVIGTGTGQAASRASVGWLLSLAPVRLLGRVSYAWYLWHWPILILGEEVFPVQGPEGTALLVLISLGLALLTYLLIEAPLARSRLFRKRSAASGAVGIMVMTLMATSTMAVALVAARQLVGPQQVDKVAFADVFGSVTQTAGPVTPAPVDAAGDVPQRTGDCLLEDQVEVPEYCSFGDPNGIAVVLFGDSHAHQWQPAIQEIAETEGWNFSILTKAGCPVPNLAPRDTDNRFSRPGCLQFRKDSLETIAELSPRYVFVSALHTYIPEREELLRAWRDSLDKLRKAGTQIIYIRDSPWFGEDMAECISGALEDWSQCGGDAQQALGVDVIADRAVRGSERDLKLIDLDGFLCDESTCPAVRNGLLLYRDHSHLTATAARALADPMRKQLAEMGVVSPQEPTVRCAAEPMGGKSCWREES